ncbi:MAG: hypothetical protein GEV03_18880 [Streptosporangiales bacterium]|nr:hypothetical protein [Streptosporangiales bacterium]
MSGLRGRLQRKSLPSGLRGGRWGTALGTLANFVVFFAIWQLIQTFFPIVDPKWVPPPTEIFAELYETAASGELLEHARYSYANMFAAYLVSVLVGIPLGLAMGGSRVLRSLLARTCGRCTRRRR